MSNDPNGGRGGKQSDGTHPEDNPLHMSDVEFDREPGGGVPPGEFETKQPSGSVGSVHHRDVGTIQLLRHAGAAGPVLDRVTRKRTKSRFWLDGGKRFVPVRHLHDGRLSDSDRWRFAGGQVSWHPSLDVVGRLDHCRRAHHAGRDGVLRNHAGQGCFACRRVPEH